MSIKYFGRIVIYFRGILIMCYTLHASSTAFAVNVCTSLLLMQFDPVLGMFFMYVGLMQLYDLIFWKNLSQNDINYWFTKIAMLTNHLQPIVLALLIIYVGKRELSRVTICSVVLYSIVAMIYSVQAWFKLDYTLVDADSTPSLNWQWNHMPNYFLVYTCYLVAFILLMHDGFDWPLNWMMIIICLVSFVLSYHYYKGKTAVGRFWCYFASYIPLLLVFYIVTNRVFTNSKNFHLREN